MSDEQAKDDERRSTPSIIIDPSLTQDAADESPGFLTDEDADRAADSIRPSWAPSTLPPSPAPRAPSERPPTVGPLHSGDIPVPPQRSERIVEDALLAGNRKRKRKGQLLVAVAALAIAAMLILPMLSSMSAPTPAASEPAANAGAPVQTETAATAAPTSEDAADTLEIVAPPEASQTPPAGNALETAPATAELPIAEATPDAPAADGPPVMFRIRTVPRHAKLFLDGEAVDNPFDGPVPGGRDVVIEAHARHFIPTRLTARSDRDRIIGVSLKRRRRKR